MSTALNGNLKDFGIAEVFQLIGQQRKTGILEISGEEERIRIAFDAVDEEPHTTALAQRQYQIPCRAAVQIEHPEGVRALPVRTCPDALSQIGGPVPDRSRSRAGCSPRRSSWSLQDKTP